jgi:methylenetetrahydrofolate reductase (NADPH)
MKLAQYFAAGRKPVISFEVFPPKTDKAMAQLLEAVPRLIALRPDFLTVTYGALGSTQARTLEIATLLKRSFGYEAASHLTCVGASRQEIDGILDRLTAEGIENIVALRGDPPQGEAQFTPAPGGFRHASELVAHIRGTGRFGIAVAGYPEKHIEAPDLETDLRRLKHKVDQGADIVVTQLFYDNADYFAFVERARALGVRQPIVPGLLPIQSFAQIKRITSLCGAKIPPALHDELEAAGEDAARVEGIGVRWAVAQARELLRRGAPGIHFYVLNRAAHMERIVGEIG